MNLCYSEQKLTRDLFSPGEWHGANFIVGKVHPRKIKKKHIKLPGTGNKMSSNLRERVWLQSCSKVPTMNSLLPSTNGLKS